MQRQYLAILTLSTLLLLGGTTAARAEQRAARPALGPMPTAMATGVLEGSLGYPSDLIPRLVICAENITSRDRYCTDTRIEADRYTYGVGYRLTVPAGIYHVFASEGQMQAYYSPAVACGLKLECTDHQPLPVTVLAGQTTRGIDPIDWFGNLPSPIADQPLPNLPLLSQEP